MEFHHTVTTLDRFQHAHQQIWSQKSELHFYFVLFCCFCFFVILTDTDWHWTHPAGIVCLIVKKARRAEMWILVTKNQNAASLRAATVWSSPPHLDVYTSVEEVCFFLQPFVVCSGAFFFFLLFFFRLHMTHNIIFTDFYCYDPVANHTVSLILWRETDVVCCMLLFEVLISCM